jgi:hypothetical protein
MEPVVTIDCGAIRVGDLVLTPAKARNLAWQLVQAANVMTGGEHCQRALTPADLPPIEYERVELPKRKKRFG